MPTFEKCNPIHIALFHHTDLLMVLFAHINSEGEFAGGTSGCVRTFVKAF
jgi:hypothetical protein